VATPLQSNGKQLLCGTHAYSPQCRIYERVSPGVAGSGGETRFIEREQLIGQGIAPYDPRHNSTFIYSHAESELFVGTVADIGAMDPLIYRRRLPRGESLRTPKDERVLDAPQFVGSFSHGDYVYFFFREVAVETREGGGVGANGREAAVYSRVARVCASEVGGPTPLQDRWSTFLKARLNCSMPGGTETRERGSGEATAAFYFNEIRE